MRRILHRITLPLKIPQTKDKIRKRTQNKQKARKRRPLKRRNSKRPPKNRRRKSHANWDFSNIIIAASNAGRVASGMARTVCAN